MRIPRTASVIGCLLAVGFALSLGRLRLIALADGWAELGVGSASSTGISDSGKESSRPAIAMGSNGLPCVAWTEATASDAEIYLRCWNGDSWVGLGGSASGGGISDNAGESSDPKLYSSLCFLCPSGFSS